ncbi:MAG: glycosyltransferase [Planctomycetes bacterium]|jgi:glycogen(starch) synthase|nr:glycosyltransferase [Planctomycetota bacterium]
MRVFMLGWEFPPHISGGLGTACYGMTKGLDEIGVQVCFVLPTAVPVGGAQAATHVDLRSPANVPDYVELELEGSPFENVSIYQARAALEPYASPGPQPKTIVEQRKTSPSSPSRKVIKTSQSTPQPSPAAQPAAPSKVGGGSFIFGGGGGHYNGNLMDQVNRYAHIAVSIASKESFDVIHAHDWMTYKAGLAVAAATGKPLVVHVHSTEFDRSGENVNQVVYDIEHAGMHGADRVVCVSHLTQTICEKRYGVSADKCTVVYNAVELPDSGQWELSPIRREEKIVLFLGRVTFQKGPEYFLQAAQKVVEHYPNVRFVMAGSGDMIAKCIRMAADLRLGRYVTFTGFLRGADVDKVFRMADLYVMPSVSEPFGIAPLEALGRNVPVIISKQSGVSEVLNHALKVDFWDTEEMANKILAVLRHPPLQKTLRQHGQIELRKFSWRDTAAKLEEVYSNATQR